MAARLHHFLAGGPCVRRRPVDECSSHQQEEGSRRSARWGAPLVNALCAFVLTLLIPALYPSRE